MRPEASSPPNASAVADATIVAAQALLPTETGEIASAELRFVANAGANAGAKKPLVLALHGFKAFARWGFFPYVGEYFARCGAISLVANYSLNGTNAGDEDFTAPGKFARNTVGQECADARAVLRAFEGKTDAQTANEADSAAWRQAREIWNGELFIVGHSRGGAVAWIVAPEFSRIRGVAAWGTLRALNRFTPRQKAEWREAGFTEVLNSRTGQMMRLNVEYLDDLERNAERYEPLKAIRSVAQAGVGVLLAHGEQDMTVPPGHSLALAKAYAEAASEAGLGGEARTLFIPRAGHTFGAVHPFAGSAPALDETLEATRIFFGLSKPLNFRQENA